MRVPRQIVSFQPSFPKARSQRQRWGRLGWPSHRGAFSSAPAEKLGQPQDGSIDLDASSSPSAEGPLSATGLRELDDARLTGGTRSLMRRALGLNVPQTARNGLKTLPAWVRKPAIP